MEVSESRRSTLFSFLCKYNFSLTLALIISKKLAKRVLKRCGSNSALIKGICTLVNNFFYIATVVYSQKTSYKIDPFRHIAIILYKKALTWYSTKYLWSFSAKLIWFSLFTPTVLHYQLGLFQKTDVYFEINLNIPLLLQK